MKLLLAGASFDPRTGGPAYSVPALGKALARRGVEVGIWSADGSPPPPPVAGMTALGGGIAQAIARFGAPDLLHDNGIWLPHHHRIATLCGRQRIPRIVSLRGMLEPWALGHRRMKKWLAWRLYQRRDLANAAMLHATATAEQDNAAALGLDARFCVIPNGVALPRRTSRPPRESGAPRTALFLSRVHPKKGLPMLVRAWGAARPKDWRLLIAGPDEEGHAAQVSALINELSLGDRIRLLGPVYDAEKETLMRSADLFVLPTFSENFGLVVAEALAYGMPVLTTYGAPWQMLETHRCGWWVAPEEGAIEAGLRAATATPSAELQAMGQRGAAIVAEQFDWDRIAVQFIDTYQAMLADR